MSADHILDLKSLRQLVGDDMAAIRAVLDKFLTTTKVAIDELSRMSALTEGDAPDARLAALAHRLKGAAGTVGASAIMDTARNAEQAYKLGHRADGRDYVQQLPGALADLERKIKTL